MAKKAYPRKPSARKRDYDTIAAKPGTTEQLARLAEYISAKHDGLFVSKAHALSVAVDEALAKRGLK